MNKTKRIEIRLSEEDYQNLCEKVNRTGLNKTKYLSMLIRNVVPHEKPDDEFFNAMKSFYSISNNLNLLITKDDYFGFVDAIELRKICRDISKLELEIRNKFLVPTKFNDTDFLQNNKRGDSYRRNKRN